MTVADVLSVTGVAVCFVACAAWAIFMDARDQQRFNAEKTQRQNWVRMEHDLLDTPVWQWVKDAEAKAEKEWRA